MLPGSDNVMSKARPRFTKSDIPGQCLSKHRAEHEAL